MRILTLISVTVAGAVTVPACKAERPGGDDKADAGVAESLDPPAIDTSVPMSTPNDMVAVRGTTAGTRIVVKGSGDPVVRASLPTGGFCVEAPLQPSGPTTLNVFALKDGLISMPSIITVTKDAAAPIPSMPNCLGMEDPVCVPESPTAANCANGKDDDCNGYTDSCDPSCNGCMDDALGPNWEPFFVPMVAAGTYQAAICPCRDDWFAFQASASDVIHVKSTFTAALIDIDMKLQTASAAEMNSSTTVAQSITTTGTEEINFTVTTAGLYYLHIYPYKKDDQGKYTLTIY